MSIKNLVARIFSKRVSMLEGVIALQQEEINKLNAKNLVLSATNRTLESERRGYWKLVSKSIIDIAELQSQIANLKGDGAHNVKKVATAKFMSWMTKTYGLYLKDGNLYYESTGRGGSMNIKMPKKK
jgi:hypothetical protein